MFHHFHDNHNHIVQQGSISAEQFSGLIEFYARNHNILKAEDFFAKAISHDLAPEDACLSFDDALLCQYEVALPVMEKYGLTAFWFVYTSPLAGIREKLEVYRHFRFRKYTDIESFYEEFFEVAASLDKKAMAALNAFDPSTYLQSCPFYTANDRRFRYLRDHVLEEECFTGIMDRLMKMRDYDPEKNAAGLWLEERHMRKLHQGGHILGLHSWSHPTNMASRGYESQKKEYSRNKNDLENILQDAARAVSYPCNSYNADTIRCMKELGVQVGFRANMDEIRPMDPVLEIPREDHANIMARMRKEAQ